MTLKSSYPYADEVELVVPLRVEVDCEIGVYDIEQWNTATDASKLNELRNMLANTLEDAGYEVKNLQLRMR